MPRLLAFAVACLLLIAVACSSGDNDEPSATSTTSVTSEPTAAETPTAGETPASRIPNVAPAADISLPAGFAAYPIATGFSSPTSVAPAADGTIYVSEGASITRLSDPDGDGVFDKRTEFANVSGASTGIMVASNGDVYISHTGVITVARDTTSDGVADETKDIITGLPTGRHQNNGLAIGPDGKLYFTNGSDCDDCTESDPRLATIQQSNIDGSGSRVYAKGLRNPYDLVFDPQGRLWASDNGSDVPCGTVDEVDFIVDGGDYGWPYGEDGCDPTKDGTPPVADLGLHTAATGIAYYDSSLFPADYRGNLFVTLWGDLGFTEERAGRYLALVTLDEASGEPTGTMEKFGTGFDHPIDVFADRDGSLLVLDHGSGTLYRVVYTGH